MIKETQNFSFKVRNIEIWNNPNYTFHLNFVGEKLFIILSVSVLSVSVSADMKIIISVFYRYRPIWKKVYRSYTETQCPKYICTIFIVLILDNNFLKNKVSAEWRLLSQLNLLKALAHILHSLHAWNKTMQNTVFW